jgi:RNA polymerase sigma factor (sigma-70 family)
MDEESLSRLISHARAGDKDAVNELLQQFGDEVRRLVRRKLPRALRPVFDSMDFAQMVWKSVLLGAGSDPGPFANSRHFQGFLAGVVRNKVYQEYRRRTSTKNDIGREEPLYVRRGDREVPLEVAATDPTPSQDAQARDRLAQLLKGRSPQEQRMIELRRLGLTFEEIAGRLGLHETTVRKAIKAIGQVEEGRGG